MAAETPITVDSLRELAAKADAGESIETTDTGDDSPEVDSSPTQEREAPTQDEIEKAEEAKEAESSETTEEKVLSKEEKEAERYDRNWKKLEERRAEVERRERELAEKKSPAKAKTLEDLRSEPDEDGYSVKDYEFAIKKLKEEGDEENLPKAEAKARKLFFDKFQGEWTRNMNELIDEHPDLSDSRKPFTIACDKVLSQLPFLKTIPDGCRYAVRIALGETGTSMVSELRAENKKLKQEVEQFHKASRLSGSLPSKLPSGKSFDDMSSKERLDHLRDLAEAADRGEM